MNRRRRLTAAIAAGAIIVSFASTTTGTVGDLSMEGETVTEVTTEQSGGRANRTAFLTPGAGVLLGLGGMLLASRKTGA